MPEADKIATRYDAEQYESNYPDGSECHYWPIARARILRRQLESLGGADRVGDVLDIGCGRGMMVACLRQWGYQAIGCDPGEARPLDAEVTPYLSIGTDAFDLPPETRTRTKLILLLDVLEHIEEPASFLGRCAMQFPNFRYILATLPARQELWSNYDEYFWHYRRYDRKSVATLIAEAEFRIERTRYFFHSLYGAAWVLKTFGRKRRVTGHAPSPKMRWLHRIVAKAFYWESRLLPKWMPGTSLMVLMERRQRDVTISSQAVEPRAT